MPRCARCAPARFAGRPRPRRAPPLGVAHGVGAAGQPPLLPPVARMLGQPAQHRINPSRRGARATRSSVRVNGAASTRASTSPVCSVAGHDGAEIRGGNAAQQCCPAPITAAAAAVGACSGGACSGGACRCGDRLLPPAVTMVPAEQESRHSAPISRRRLAPPGRGRGARAVMGEDLGDHVAGHRREIQLGGGQVGVSEDPLHVGQRQLRVPRHPVGGGMPQVVQRPVGPQRGGGAGEHRPRRVVGQRPKRAAPGPPQQVVTPGRHRPASPHW